MNILELIKDRRSARAFKPDSISRKIIIEILELTINAPSANNLQPWEFTVVMDKEKERLSESSGESGPLVRAKWASHWKGLGGVARGMGLF